MPTSRTWLCARPKAAYRRPGVSRRHGRLYDILDRRGPIPPLRGRLLAALERRFDRVPKSSHRDHITQNADGFDLALANGT